jgi:hypothetical protein
VVFGQPWVVLHVDPDGMDRVGVLSDSVHDGVAYPTGDAVRRGERDDGDASGGHG